jgi:hypothetical protein
LDCPAGKTVALWMVGHGMIWNGQAIAREKSRQYARVDMEDTDDLAWEINNGLEDLNCIGEEMYYPWHYYAEKVLLWYSDGLMVGRWCVVFGWRWIFSLVTCYPFIVWYGRCLRREMLVGSFTTINSTQQHNFK